MHAYCVRVSRMSDDVAYKLTRVARLARRFPMILDEVAAGRLHLSGLLVLKRYLTEQTAADLLAASAHKTRAEIEQLLAERYPRPDLPTVVRVLPPGSSASAGP